MNLNTNRGWDYHVPPDHRLVDPNISLANHSRAIFQASMWDSNRKNHPGHPKAKPPHPHQ